jgi:hypothetical protein
MAIAAVSNFPFIAATMAKKPENSAPVVIRFGSR